MRKNQRGLAAVMATIVAATSTVGGYPLTVQAEENVDVQESAKKVNVRLSVQQEQKFIAFPKEYEVSSDAAETFGYKDKEGVVTALDCLVALHQAMYGDAFTPETLQEYLVGAENGWLTKMFGQSGAIMFLKNGYAPHGDKIAEWDSNQYVSDLIGDAVINEGDDLEFLFLHDQQGYMDNYTWIYSDDQKINKISALSGDELELAIKGYVYGWYSSNLEADIDTKTKAVEEAVPCILDENGNVVKEYRDNISDEDGKFVISLDDIAPGDYYLSAGTDISDEYAISIVCPTVALTVAAERTELINNSLADLSQKNDPWVIIELAKAGKLELAKDLEGYKASAYELITTATDKTKATELEKAIIALSALGIDATDITVAGKKYNAVSALENTAINNISAVMFALTAIDSGKYNVAESSVLDRTKLINDLLGKQTADKGWCYWGDKADADMTAMVVQSLAPYYTAGSAEEAGISNELYDRVKLACNEAIIRLSEMQLADGTYGNANSTEMVLLALSAVGINGNRDNRFIKNGNSVYFGVLKFALNDESGFCYTVGDKYNTMATEQGMRALIAFYKFRENGSAFNLYMSGSLDKPDVPEKPTPVVDAKKEFMKQSVKSLSASKASYQSAKLSWKKVSNADGYYIYRATSKTGSFKKIATVKGLKYTDSKLTCGRTYYYKVRAYKNIKGENVKSVYSSVRSARPVLDKAAVSLSTKKNAVTIKWKKVSGASGYCVYSATSKNGKYTKVKTITGNKTFSYKATKLKAGKKYYYKVRAYRNVNNQKIYGDYSTVKSIKVVK